nr:ribonuclease H-like domain-containing protein [Tanacetum cinerariifolium]
MTGNKSYLTDYEEIDGGFVAFGGNSKRGKITGKGNIRSGKLDFEDVYFVKELKFNLFSVSQMCDKKNNVLFTNTACVVLSLDFKLTDKSHVLLKVPRKDNIYIVDLKNVVSQRGLTCLFEKATLDESNLWHIRLGHTQDPLVSFSSKDSPCAGFKPSRVEVKKDAKDLRNEDSEVPSTEEPRVNQKKDINVTNTNNIISVSPTDNAVGIEDNVVDKNIVCGYVNDLNMPDLEEINRFSDAENDDSGADMNNLDTHFQVSPIPTTRIHKDHSLNQVIGDLQSTTQTRQMTKNLDKYEFVSTTLKQRTSHKDLQNCLFSCFLSQEEPKKIVQALKDPS